MDPTTSRDSKQTEFAFRGEPRQGEPREVQASVSADSNVSMPGEPLSGFAAGAPEGDLEPLEQPLWVRRLSLIILVVFCIEVGLLLAVLPWTRVWTDNSLLVRWPSLRATVHHDFVRGLVTGLGLVDIWLGIWEAVRYREK